MPSKIFSATNIGLQSHLIEVEADIIYADPKFLIVGLPDIAVQESRERVRSAIKNSDLPFPRSRVTVNLAPADLKKVGPSFDLPIAVSVMIARGLINLACDDKGALFIGELSLDGTVRPINGILAVASAMKSWGLKRIYLPKQNAEEAALINGLDIFPIDHLTELVSHLKNKQLIVKFKKRKKTLKPANNAEFDLSHIKGQEHVKRALEITAAGYHNLLMTGPPGSGKTLLAKALADLLPPLSFAESLEVTKIYSVAGLLPPQQPLITGRPFRSPHHTSSGIALVGGGSFPKPGEITLAHRGILFLDELPEFPRNVLENLRQPMEDGIVTVSRASTSVQFPSKFTLVATANPCPCGFATDNQKECTCTLAQIQRYQKRISGPLLDRIDLQVEVPRVNTEELFEKHPPKTKSENLQEKIIKAQKLQLQRFKKLNILYNSEMDHKLIEKLCPLDAKSEQLLKQAITKFQLSARSYHKVLKISRTIADLESAENIELNHLAEALQYRKSSFYPAPL